MLILLKQRYVEQVLNGTKTSTIRSWPRCHLRPGSPISFNGRHRAICTKITQMRVADLSDSDICDDGFDSRAAFYASFFALYPHATPETPVWVIRFALNDSAQSARASAVSGQLSPQ